MIYILYIFIAIILGIVLFMFYSALFILGDKELRGDFWTHFLNLIICLPLILIVIYSELEKKVKDFILFNFLLLILIISILIH